MLVNRNPKDKTYQELLRDAIMQIPLYTDEWTNFNPSDPGITILENLTAFEALQQESIHRITPQIRQKLLKMLGFTERKGRCARALLAAENLTGTLEIAPNERFVLGELVFETGKKTKLSGCRLTGIYAKEQDTFTNLGYLISREIPRAAMIFGRHPGKGAELYFVSDSLPEPGEEVIFYMTMADRFNRNPAEEKGNNTFAALEWECYTETGYESMNVMDHTSCFLRSGEVRMRLPGTAAAICHDLPVEGYVIRARLEKADYDIAPRLCSVKAFLFEVWQKDTRSVCYTFPKCAKITLNSRLAEEGYLQVFCKEEKGAFYRKYEQLPDAGSRGRYYTMQKEGDGIRTFCFDRRSTGYAPERLKNAVKIMVYSEEIMRQYYLGEVLGYDDQEMMLPVKNIAPDSFSIIAKRLDADGEEIYDFVRPNHYEEDSLSYYLLENEGKIVIEDAGAFIGATLYMGGCSVTRGAEGNIRENNRLLAEGELKEIRFINAGPGTGGCFRESIGDVKQRFLEDMNQAYTAVTAEDYEMIVQNAPGLCIHKVRAVLNPEKNLVQIAVKPGTDERFPVLSGTYRRCLEELLEQRRLLTTRIEVVDPVYIPVNVKGVIYVRRHYEKEKGRIEEVLKQKLDYLGPERGFGEVLRYDEVFRAVEELSCVEYIYELTLYPQNPNSVKMRENDIYPAPNGLCYAGEIQIEIRNYEK